MGYTTLVSAAQLQALVASTRPHRVFDCSFDLAQPHAGAQQFVEARIPGAVYADLETDLSARHGALGSHGVLTAGGADTSASGGRHPLPNRERFAEWLSSVGFANDMQAVVYDRSGGNYCGRLWWMLKWAGHEPVAVLDGGLQAWEEAGGELQSGEPSSHFQSNFSVLAPLSKLVTTQMVVESLGGPDLTIVDARSEARFRGEVEPIDPRAGHIPGALNRPYACNFDAVGRFKPAAQLHNEFEALLGERPAATVVHHCGSGVSAVPNLLAMEIAGLGVTGLYAGSWSEWSSDPERPIATGA